MFIRETHRINFRYSHGFCIILKILYNAISVLVSLFREYQKCKANTLIGYFISPIYKLEE